MLGISGSKAGRRLVSIAAMLAGAAAGAALIRHTHAFIPLAIALVIIVIGAAVSHVVGRSDSAWLHPQR